MSYPDGKIVFSIENQTITVITNYPLKKSYQEMNVHYDNEVGALYIKLGNKVPEGVVELSEGINLDTTEQGKLVGIEILQASTKIDMNTLLSYSLDLGKGILGELQEGKAFGGRNELALK